MSVQLPQSGQLYLPEPPAKVKTDSPDLYEYMQKTRKELTRNANGIFDNTNALANAINSGTSGTFVVTSGSSIVVVNGIITSVT